MQKGIQKGLQKGKEEGLAEGLQKGKEAGKKEQAIKIAKNLLDILDSETISEKTGLTISEIENLKQNNDGSSGESVGKTLLKHTEHI